MASQRAFFVSACAVLVAGVLLAGCSHSADETGPIGIAPPIIELEALQTCEEVAAAFDAELRYVRYCTRDEQCGTPMPRTSCGCTRDLVARRGAETARFYTLAALASEWQCGVGFASTCDCPPAEGFACVDNQCAWKYVQRGVRP